MRRIRFALSFAALLCFGAGLAPAADKPQIAVIPKGTTHEFWKSIHAGAVKASKEFDVDIIWQGPLKEDDREQQIQIVGNFISRKVDAIVLAPLDDVALARPVNTATQRGIRVVIIDSDLKTNKYVSFVATDNYKGGRLAGERLGKLLGGKGRALMLRYAEGSASTMKREQGFLDAMKEKYPNIDLVSTNQYGGATRESAFKASQNLLNKFQDVDGIFTPNESTTFGMLRALQTAGLAGKIKFVGFDTAPSLLKAIREGELHGVTAQNPFAMGYLGVKAAVEALEDQKVDKRIDTGAVMITPENIDDPSIQEVIAPDLDKWLK